MLQPSFKNRQHHRDLLLKSLLRLVNPQQAFFKLRRTFEAANSVASQSTSQTFDECRRKPFALRIQHAQVREQVCLSARHFASGTMVNLRFAVEEGRYLHKGAQDFVFASVDVVALDGTNLAPGGKHLAYLCGKHIKPEHEAV